MKEMIIIIENGVVHDIINAPEGIKISIWDYDVERIDENMRLKDCYGMEYTETVFTDGKNQ